MLTSLPTLAKGFDYADLRSLIIGQNLHSVEEVLPLLPDTLRAHYVLMRQSRSLQGSTEADPRVILFDQTTGFVVSFNGEATLKGYSALETMQFDYLQKTFQFREINFSTTNAVNPGTAKAEFSEDNPQKCMQCHGSPAAPIWDSFPNWPGAYGERYNTHLSEQERASLQRFLDKQPIHPRYKYLLNVERFGRPETFKPDGKSQYAAALIEPPNAQLGEFLARLNLQRLARATEKAPNFSTFGYAILGSVSAQCGDIDEYFPSDVRPALMRGYAAFVAQTDRRNRGAAVLKSLRSVSPTKPGAIHDADALTAYRYLAKFGLAAAERRWSLALEQDDIDFTNREPAAPALAYYLGTALARQDQRLKDLISLQVETHDGKYCRYLRQKSIALITGMLASDPSWQRRLEGTQFDLYATEILQHPGGNSSGNVNRSGTTSPAMLQTCVNCHTGAVGPALPFGEPQEMARLLIEKRYRRGNLLDEILYRLAPDSGASRMPMNVDLTEEQRLELTNYFRNLASQHE